MYWSYRVQWQRDQTGQAGQGPYFVTLSVASAVFVIIIACRHYNRLAAAEILLCLILLCSAPRRDLLGAHFFPVEKCNGDTICSRTKRMGSSPFPSSLLQCLPLGSSSYSRVSLEELTVDLAALHVFIARIYLPCGNGCTKFSITKFTTPSTIISMLLHKNGGKQWRSG